MTRASVMEYAAALRRRYAGATKTGRGALLTEFCATTGYHRKAAIRLLGREPSAGSRRIGRPRLYGGVVEEALAVVWEASDRACGKRLAPFLAELVGSLERHGELEVSVEVREQLLSLSAATIDRRLATARRRGLRRPWNQGKTDGTLRAQIPIRTFGEWEESQPGSVQADLVLHCGETLEGFHLTTLTVVDVCTGWTECEAVWGKGQERVGGALDHARRRLPFTLRELHTDNGSEFLNHHLQPYCRRQGIRVTRGRPYRKNDQAFVEQKNGAVVRRLIGYDRYSSHAAYSQLGRVYALLRLYGNFFQPVRKVRARERVGARVVKRYDTAKTPYQRLLGTGVLTEAQERVLAAEYEQLNPVRLRDQIGAGLEALWKAAEQGRRRA